MVPDYALASLPDSLVNQLRQNGVLEPISKRSYRCKICTASFPCHEPLQYHARVEHSHTVQHVYTECKLLPGIIIDIHGLYCRRGTHYVRVTTLTFLGLFSRVEEIVTEEELTFEEFLKRDFSPTETYKETVTRVKEFDKTCCRPVYATFTELVEKVLSCFACIPVPKRSRSRRCSSNPDMRLTSLSQSTKALTADDERSQDVDDLTLTTSRSSRPDTKSPSQSTETLTANDKRSQDVDDPASTARNSLPEHVTGIVAVAAFFSTADGVQGHEVLVTTRSDTIILLGLVDLDALLQHPRMKKQLQVIISGHTYAKLLEYRKKPERAKDTKDPVYRGNLPDDLLIEVGEEVRLEDCSPVLQAEVRSILDS